MPCLETLRRLARRLAVGTLGCNLREARGDGNCWLAQVSPGNLFILAAPAMQITSGSQRDLWAQVYRGKVSNVMDFGAFVELQGTRQRAEGLVHVSEISKTRANSAREVLNRGQECWVKVMRVSTAGGKQQLSLSMRDVDQVRPPSPPPPLSGFASIPCPAL